MIEQLKRWSGLRTIGWWTPSWTGTDPAIPYLPLETPAGGGEFPTQFFGLKAFYQAAVNDLCLVAEADAPAGMGGVLKVRKGATSYAVYLVETTDPNASQVRVCTSSGVKSVREKT